MVVGGAGSVTVMVTACVFIPAALITVTTSGYEPAVPAAGVPATVAVPDGCRQCETGRQAHRLTNTLAVGVAAAETPTVPALPTTKLGLPVVVTTAAGTVPVLEPGVSQPLTSPPYDSRVAPVMIVPAGAVIGTEPPVVLVTVIWPFCTYPVTVLMSVVAHCFCWRAARSRPAVSVRLMQRCRRRERGAVGAEDRLEQWVQQSVVGHVRHVCVERARIVAEDEAHVERGVCRHDVGREPVAGSSGVMHVVVSGWSSQLPLPPLARDVYSQLYSSTASACVEVL